MAIDGASGAAAGAVSDYGIDDNLLKELGEKLEPGDAAVFVLVRQGAPRDLQGWRPRHPKFAFR